MGNAPWSAPPPGSGPVHPHVHGERCMLNQRSTSGRGSSPRTWGTPSPPGRGAWAPRFIPTYMGNASPRSPTKRRRPVHPHVHGERIDGAEYKQIGTGSSPRTWGTPGRCQAIPTHRRFIPTYMGNAFGRSRTARYGSVHPHVHGERFARWVRARADTGSSPRTWGTLDECSDRVGAARFIPTYMGNAP